MRAQSVIGALLILTGSACASSQAEQVRDARDEQANARQDSQTQLAEQNGEARDKAIEQRHDAVSSNIDATNPPGESGAQNLVQVSEERLKYQSDKKTELDKVGAKIEAAREKLTVLGGKAPTALREELATTSQQYKNLQDDVKSLDKTPASNWEARTDQVDKQLSLLKDRVDDLTDKIEDVKV